LRRRERVEKTLKVLNDLEKKGVIKRYVIGGGIAVLFYAESILTYDLDVFCLLPTERGGLITLSPIYEYLQAKGYKVQEEHIVIEGIPVQFIPAYNELVEEALGEAIETTYKQVKTRIVRAEHLLAIMLQTYRPKDRERILLLLDEAQIDMPYLEKVLERHGLQDKWSKFRRRYREE
jgi:DNA-binding Lrp family transcriptional regulator